MYKILHKFSKNDEPWAKLQKTDSQFRAKSYDVKESEIVPIPGTLHGEAYTNTSSTNDTYKSLSKHPSPSTTEKHSLPLFDGESGLNVLQSATDKSRANSVHRRTQKRKAALKSMDLTKTLIKEQLLLVEATSRPSKSTPPSHGWDWDEFSLLHQEYDDAPTDQNSKRRHTPRMDPVETDSQTDFDQFWDNSPEQYMLSSHAGEDNSCLHYEDSSLVFNSRTFFPSQFSDSMPSPTTPTLQCPMMTRDRIQAISSESYIPGNSDLTSEDSMDEVFPIDDPRPLTRSALSRRHAIRRKQPKGVSAPTLTTTPYYRSSTKPRLPCPVDPETTNTVLTQDLHRVLPTDAPLVPESVDVRSNRALRL